MNLIDDKVRLKQYAVMHPEDIFTRIDEECKSYWNEKEQGLGMIEYSFETPLEMSELLNQYITDSELQKIIIAASYKRKSNYSIKKSDAKLSKEEKLPEFVYAF